MSQKLNDISFTLGQGGSGRTPTGLDFISGLMFFNNTRPAALLASLPGGVDNFSTGSVKQLFSLADAESVGIVDTYTDETKSIATLEITNAGATGDKVTVSVQEWVGGVAGGGLIVLGAYTNLASDNIETVVDGLVAAINAGTNVHGYTAADTGDTETTIFITARPGIGKFLNVSGYVKAVTGSMAGTLTHAATAGVASKLAVYHYHIDRFFRKNPDAYLYVGIFNTSGAATMVDLDNMMNASGNLMVQCGVWDDTQTFALATLTVIQTKLNLQRAANKFLSSVIYAADIKAIGAISSLGASGYNLATLNDNNVSSLIDNDGNGVGFDLFEQQAKTISSLGNAIGTLSLAAISQDYGECSSQFDADDGVEFDTLMFGDGTLYNNVSKSLLDQLNTNRYVFLSKVPNNTAHSWYSDDHAAVAYTSDYAWTHDNRVIDRVIRNMYTSLTPVLKSKLKLKTDGTLTAQQISAIVGKLGAEVIAPLIASEDLAGDPNNFDATKWILVSASQKPNVAGKLVIGVKLAENGIAHSISVPIGFGTFS